MESPDFRAALASGRIILLDGGMGTMLQAAGMPPGVSPDEFCLERPDILFDIHSQYIKAGSDIITACTFGANPFKLRHAGDVFHINRKLTAIARAAAAEAGRKVFVAGNLGPSGHFVRPLGELEPRKLVDAYRRQLEGLLAGGVDLIFIETQFDLAEARAAMIAARESCDLPLMVSMTFEGGQSLTGSSPAVFAETMQNMCADALGANCSLGPEEMKPVIRELLATARCPVLAEPNAGMPVLRGHETVFPLAPDIFAEKTAQFAAMGARILGGCCGTTPRHIAALRLAVEGLSLPPPNLDLTGDRGFISLTSRSRLVRIGAEQPFVLIGERINPTGKAALAAELQNGVFEEAIRLADAQVEAGAAVLDINVGAPLVDESLTLPALVEALVSRLDMPFALDSSSARAIEAALPYCPGSFLVNSLSGEEGKIERLGPICRNYGAPFILLPLLGADLPESLSERLSILEKLLQQLESLKIPRHLVLVDILAMSAASMAYAPKACLELARWCAREKLPTTYGLSNVSFGLPARDLINSTFLSMCAGAGLASCIANPSRARVREELDAVNLLLGHDSSASVFIGRYGSWRGGENSSSAAARKEGAVPLTAGEAVLKGDLEGISALLEQALASGVDAYTLVEQELIPAITRVGERYEKKEYFLPQLIRSAETMQKAMQLLKPRLEQASASADRPVVVLATVEGDIHDIGKNIVALLLGNHGFEVIDAGKDVPASVIVECAEKHGARIIGLSALMTTTMVRMEDTVRLIRARGLPIRVLVGGASVTPEFAESIGADAYCEDAVSTVRAAREFSAVQQINSVNNFSEME